MRLCVLGAGKMGKALAWVLVRARGPAEVTVVDADAARAKALADSLGCAWATANFADEHAMAALLRDTTVAISAADYALNESLTRVAIRTQTHLCDLGGNIHVVARQRAMNAEAERAGVTIVPDCGLAPGLACFLAARAVEKVRAPLRVQLRVGGLPRVPRPPLGYSLFFAIRGLTNEYFEPAELLRDGQKVRLPCLTEVESLEFPPPLGTLEAFTTSGGASTLVETLAGKVRDLDYKTIRYPGHAHIFKAMIDLGFLSETPVPVAGVPVVPRQLTEAVLERSLDHGDDDVVLVRVTVEGEDGERLTHQIIDYKDHARGHSAMMRGTSYPTAVVALMMADGRITKRGVVPGELCVPVDDLVTDLADLGLVIETTHVAGAR